MGLGSAAAAGSAGSWPVAGGWGGAREVIDWASPGAEQKFTHNCIQIYFLSAHNYTQLCEYLHKYISNTALKFSLKFNYI